MAPFSRQPDRSLRALPAAPASEGDHHPWAERRALRLTGNPAIAARVGRAPGLARTSSHAGGDPGAAAVLAATVRAVQRHGWRATHPFARAGPPPARGTLRGDPARAARLVYGGGRSPAEAATRLGTSESQVLTWLETAKRATSPPVGADRCTACRRRLLSAEPVATGPHSALVDEVVEHLDRCAECARVADDRGFLATCLATAARLSRYQDGLCDARDAAAVDAHLDACGACTRHLHDLQQAALTLMAAGPGFTLGVAPLALVTWQSVRRLSWLRHLAGLAPAHAAASAAATALAVATAAGVALTAGPGWVAHSRPPMAPAPAAPIATPTPRVHVTPAPATPRPTPPPSRHHRPRAGPRRSPHRAAPRRRAAGSGRRGRGEASGSGRPARLLGRRPPGPPPALPVTASAPSAPPTQPPAPRRTTRRARPAGTSSPISGPTPSGAPSPTPQPPEHPVGSVVTPPPTPGTPTPTATPVPPPTLSPTPSPTPTPAPSPTAAPSASPTPTPAPSPTATPSPSPTPTPPPSPTPTVTPCPTGGDGGAGNDGDGRPCHQGGGTSNGAVPGVGAVVSRPGLGVVPEEHRGHR